MTLMPLKCSIFFACLLNGVTASCEIKELQWEKVIYVKSQQRKVKIDDTMKIGDTLIGGACCLGRRNLFLRWDQKLRTPLSILNICIKIYFTNAQKKVQKKNLETSSQSSRKFPSLDRKKFRRI
ncbi:hypothetical protein CEXT_587331 [Caerostris extrusa]|uniref:Uncharacterized protein n=1 Tax=Caerostris extrusa TaxID=172846 RepID=A0AAV4MLX3_CAEEX|nr:hypothetical protein CEXT_587331 [Caerostris extrusa]